MPRKIVLKERKEEAFSAKFYVTGESSLENVVESVAGWLDDEELHMTRVQKMVIEKLPLDVAGSWDVSIEYKDDGE